MSTFIEWIQLGKGERPYYRKKEIYEMHWQYDGIDLSDNITSACSHGGAVALTRDSTKTLQIRSHDDFTQYVFIYTSSGEILSKIPWDSVSKGSLIYLGWTDDECVICVSEDAHVYIYDIMGKLILQFGFESEVKEAGVLKAITWQNGVAILTKDYRMWVVSDLDSAYCEQFARLPATATNIPQQIEERAGEISMTVIPEDVSTCGSLEILLSIPQSNSLFFVSKSRCLDAKINYGPFPRIAASPSGETIATFSKSGILRVAKSDLNSVYAELDTKSTLAPKQIAWVGEDSVCVYWEPEQIKRDGTSLLLIIGPNGSLQKFPYDGAIHLSTEVDGLRILTNTHCQFLERVPAAVHDIFKIGSDTVSANLFDAYSDFEKNNKTNMSGIRRIYKELSPAITQCLEAASHEFDIAVQRKLLRAAAYGKGFCTDYNHTDRFVETCKLLRVLNAVREHSVGMPITIEQYERLTVEKLIDRLLTRSLHLLAFRISRYLQLKSLTSNVLLHWACTKVKSSTESDYEIFHQITDKLSCNMSSAHDHLRADQKLSSNNSDNLPLYYKVATVALRQGKRELAIKLLEREERPGEQVPLLLKMGEIRTALRQAIASGETDLIYLVILEMKKRLENREFFAIINDKSVEVAKDLFISYSKETDRDFLNTFFLALEQPHEAANLLVEDFFFCDDDFPLQKKLLTQSKDLYSKRRESYLDSKLAEQQKALIEIQHTLDQTIGKKIFNGLSVNDTIYNLLLMNDSREAKVKSDFKVSDKTYWYLKIAAYTKLHRFQDLEALAKKKSPIGYKPFVEACIKGGYDLEALKYIPRVTDPWERVELYVAINMFKEAMDTAFVAKNVDMLFYIRSKATTASTRNSIDDMIHKLSG